MSSKEIINGVELRRLRLDLGLSQSKLSFLSGVKQSRLSAFELQKSDLSLNEVSILNKILRDINKDDIKTIKKRRCQKSTDGISILETKPRRGYEKSARNSEYLEMLIQLEKRFKNSDAKQIKAISFFAGCGGLCYGVKAAGFDIVATNELVEGYKSIYKKNFPSANFLPNNIREVKTEHIEKFQGVDLMIGGPPCQGFSLAGKRDVNDSRNTLFQDYLRIAQIVKPKVVLMENVKLLTSMKDPDGSYVKDRIIDTFVSIGYDSSFFIVNAKDYGAAQDRERVIFIGVRKDLKKRPSIPEPTHALEQDFFCKKPKYFTFADAVSDLEFIESGEFSKEDSYHKAVNHPEHVIRWLIDVPEGKSAHENEDVSLRPPSGYNTTYKRLVWLEPAGTVATTFSMISGCRNVHPIATRSLTTREALRLQTFPDTFELTGKMGDIRTTIGNAVPPMLAYELGTFIRDNYIL